MGILLAFAPFLTFALVGRFSGPTQGFVAGAVVSAVLLVRDAFTAERSPKLFEMGTFLSFGGLAPYAVLVGLNLSVFGVRLCVGAELLLIVLATMAVGNPFTLPADAAHVEPTRNAWPCWSRPMLIDEDAMLGILMLLWPLVRLVSHFGNRLAT